MNIKKKLWIFSMAGVMGSLLPVTVLAASPQFARTEEEWSRLQDNVLEYDEVADLIHEYHVTVQNNQIAYSEFVSEYGRTKEDIAQSYRDLADELEASKSGENSALASDLQLQLQADQMREQADDNVEDSQIYSLNYAQAEANLVLSAKSRYIAYFRSQLQLESAKQQLTLLESAAALASAKQQAGTGTRMDVLDAQASVLSQQKTVAQLEQSIENTRQSLIVMLGWSAGDTPEISSLPEVDPAQIEAIDAEADKQSALENNYTLQVNKRKLENAQETNTKNTLQNTITSNERQIGVSVNSAYQSLQTSLMSYRQAVSDAGKSSQDLAQAQQKWSAGLSTKYEYVQAQVSQQTAAISVETAKLALLESLETYRAYVDGLAAAE